MRQTKHFFPVGEQVDEDQTGALLVEDRDEESGESEDEDGARPQLQMTRKAAWVDEDDELEEEYERLLILITKKNLKVLSCDFSAAGVVMLVRWSCLEKTT